MPIPKNGRISAKATKNAFVIVLHAAMLFMAFLFVYDFSVPKPDWKKIITGK